MSNHCNDLSKHVGGRTNPGRIKPVPADPDGDETCEIDSAPDPPKTKQQLKLVTLTTNNSKPTNGPATKGKSLFDEPADDDNQLTPAASNEGIITPTLISLFAKKDSPNSPSHQLVTAAQHAGTVKPESNFGAEAVDDVDDGGESSSPVRDFATSKFVSATYYEEGTYIPTWVKKVCKNGNEMMILAQLAYWFRRGSNNKVRASKLLGTSGYYWVAKSYPDLGDETGLTTHQARHAVDTLAARNMIIHEPHMFGGLVMSFYRIDPDAVEVAIEEAEDV